MTDVRLATAADTAEVARLLHDFNTEYSGPSPGVAALTERIGGLIADGQVTVLIVGSPPEGLAVLRFRPSFWTGARDAYLEELYVAPDRRGHGRGRALLEAAVDEARRAGAARMDLATSEDDTAAVGLYESCGFTNRERLPDGPRMLFYERGL